MRKAKTQLVRYLDRLGLSEGYRVIFDPVEKTWEAKLFFKEIDYPVNQNNKITRIYL